MRLDLEARSSNLKKRPSKNPSITLRATRFKRNRSLQQRRRRITERNVKLETDLTEPQGTLKI